MQQFSVQGKTVTVFAGNRPDSPVIYLNTVSEEGVQVLRELQNLALPDFSLVTVSHLDWNRDMVPWSHPPVWKNSEPFIGGANEYLGLLTDTILPAAEKLLPGVPRWRGLAGYSLAGLFAVYALCRTDVFSRIASVSGSLWFPGILNEIQSSGWRHAPDCVYLSLGDKESKTRNPVLKTVWQETEAVFLFCQSQHIRTVLQINPGNHFYHAVQRTADGIAWLLNQ